ncbi:DUF4365 domain-containing protein [Streptomyces indiaensis]|uniref:DUF4365 domain-containing protein n=1 Tax=Streptomyces indiaensis TaxID=284033 RepID=A0ABN3DMF2_9ACTN|nr:DUF4365 domain-containing protein [Streptomyces indiaensis]MCF1646016.1 DUF4365 domain-containing protein [Streptomyces indiaensis]
MVVLEADSCDFFVPGTVMGHKEDSHVGMRSSQQEATGSAGAHRVMADFEDLGWGPVENNQHDLGIDLFVQVRDERRFDRTVLMTVQVKSGESYFGSPERDETGAVRGWWYAESDARRFEDWVQHGLPHLMVLHNLEARVSYWAHVAKDSVVPSGEGFKILVPSSQQVERAQLPALLEVAASGKAAWSLEGTAWTAGAKAVAPGRAVRHALVAPRLIAPHPNTGHDRVLEPEEAIALFSQGRSSDLERYADANPPLQQLEQQTGWRWRFLHACLRAIEEGDVTALLQLAVAEESGHPKHTYRRAAVAVACAVFLADAERWDEAESALACAGDDLSPVDHAWVLLHRALLAGERGDVAHARSLAAESQRAVALDADDVTARAIAAAAAAFLFESSRWDTRNLEETLTTGDTASSWWRSQSIAWALADHDRKAFLSWGADEGPGATLVDWAEDRLKGVWLQASFSGARRSAAGSAAQRACHSVVHHEAHWRSTPAPARGDTDATALADAMDTLRRHGRTKELAAAVRRLWAAGPADCVTQALERSMSAAWRHTSARSKLLLWELAGDLMVVEQADVAAAECLRILDDPQAFEERVRPNFVSDYYTTAALRGILAAASDDTHAATVAHVLETLGHDDGRQEDLIRLVLALRPSALGVAAPLWRQAALDQGHPGLSAAMLGLLAHSGDAEAQETLVRRVQEGDIEAFDSLPYERATDAVSGRLAEFAAEQCRSQLAWAESNSWGIGSADYGWLLVWCGLTAPEHADWSTVLELITHPKVAIDHKIGALRLLSRRVDDVPEEVADQLRQSVAVQPEQLRGVSALVSSEQLREAAFGLALSLGVADTASLIAGAAQLLRGSPVQRRAAARLLAQSYSQSSTEPLTQGMLLALASDLHSSVRGEAATALTRSLAWTSSTVCQDAVLLAASDAGCRTPLAVARALPEACADTGARHRLAAVLLQHPSALVRNTVRSAPSAGS